MKDHVEEKAPNFSALIRPVDEDGLDGHWSWRIHLAHNHSVVRKETQLYFVKNKKFISVIVNHSKNQMFYKDVRNV